MFRPTMVILSEVVNIIFIIALHFINHLPEDDEYKSKHARVRGASYIYRTVVSQF